MFGWFEKCINLFLLEVLEMLLVCFLVFCMYYLKGVVGWFVLMVVLIVMILVGEVMLFSFFGNIVDWLINVNCEIFFWDEGVWFVFMGGFVFIGLLLIVFV